LAVEQHQPYFNDLPAILQEDAFPDSHRGHVDRMFAVADEVGAAGLPQLAPGFRMYGVVTDTVYRRHREFGDFSKLALTIPKFAQLAYDPLLLDSEKPILWQELYEQTRLSPIEAMRKFWRAHINRDLAVVLDTTDTHKDHHKADFFHVHGMLRDAAHTIREKHILLPECLGRVGVELMLGEVYVSRWFAWRDGQKLIANRGDEQARSDIIHNAENRGRLAHEASQLALRQTLSILGASENTWQDQAAA